MSAGGAGAKPVEIYTDGACRGNPGPGGWGALLIAGDARRELSGYEAQTTNNRMELMGAISALEALTRACDVVLHTDSQYVKNGVTSWILPWVTIGLLPAAVLSRVVRVGLEDAMSRPFAITARSKGFSRQVILLCDALPNIAPTFINAWGTQSAVMVVGAIVVEPLFAWHGIGDLFPVFRGINVGPLDNRIRQRGNHIAARVLVGCIADNLVDCGFVIAGRNTGLL